MADRNELPMATVEPRRRNRVSVVWIIPILAALVAIGIAVQRIMNEGPTITIVFPAAAGMEAGKTQIRYKDVTIGTVQSVELVDNYSKVMVTAKVSKDAAGLMVEDARFWVVEPRITLSGISGLGTLLSGNYIGFGAGKSTKEGRHYIALDKPPVVSTEIAGKEYLLRSAKLGSLGEGLPVYFRQFPVGEVISSALDKDGQGVTVRAFVRAPYDQYITANTRFWNASGVDVSLNAGGLDIKTQSLTSVLVGGIAFETPPDGDPAPAPARTTFTLFDNHRHAMLQPDRIVDHYVLRFKQSVRGLQVGAPVEFRGVLVGEVTRIGIEVDPQTLAFEQPVDINFYPDRLRARMMSGKMLPEPKTPEERLARTRQFIERGFRAQLRTGNLLTGQAYVAVDMFPNAPKVRMAEAATIMEIPTIPGQFEGMETKIASIIDKLDKVPYEQIVADVRKVVASLDSTVKNVDSLVKQWNTQTTPALTKAIDDAREAINSAHKFIESGSPAETDLREALREITKAATSVRVLADYLEEEPQALLRGKPAAEETYK